MFSLTEMPAALPERRDRGAIRKLHGPPHRLRCRANTEDRSTCLHRIYPTQCGDRQAEAPRANMK
jgi:hypothetical protein